MPNPLVVKTITEQEFIVGKNKTSLIENNIISVVAIGEQTDEIAEKQREINQKLAGQVAGQINYLVDLNNCGKNSPKARKIWSDLCEDKGTDKVAVFGMHPVAKVIAAFVMKISTKEMHFFNTREEAVSWLKQT